MNSKLIIASFIIFISLSSCLPKRYSVLDTAVDIKMGMSTKEFNDITTAREDELSQSWDWMSYDIEINKQKYTAITTPIVTTSITNKIKVAKTQNQINSERNQEQNRLNNSPGNDLRSPDVSTTKTSYKHPNGENNYYFVFKNDSLMYWGFLYEFLRHPNTEIETIGASILKIKKENE